jgi:hypothetical protein
MTASVITLYPGGAAEDKTFGLLGSKTSVQAN